MWIVNLTENPNGSHNDHQADHITTVPEGWAVIPDDFIVPSTFPFVTIEAEKVIYAREAEVEREVTKIREVEIIDPEGNLVTVTEEYTEMESAVEEQPYAMMTVISMAEGEVPAAPKEQPTQLDMIEAQVAYTAMMTNTLLE